MFPAVVISSWIAFIALTGKKIDGVTVCTDYQYFYSDVEAVIGGGYADEGAFPYVVAIKDVEQGSLCGGAIVSSTHVLTAAHCVDNIDKDSFFVAAGIINLDDIDDEYLYGIAKITVHEAFEAEKSIPIPDSPDEYEVQQECQNDIAIIEVDRPFNFTEDLKMVRIARNFPMFYHYCRFAGWGITDNRKLTSNALMFTDLAIRRREECVAIGCTHDKGILCVYNRRLMSTTCSGDSGGPLVCGGFVVGVASTGDCNPKLAAGFVNVLEYLPFIRSILKSPDPQTDADYDSDDN